MRSFNTNQRKGNKKMPRRKPQPSRVTTIPKAKLVKAGSRVVVVQQPSGKKRSETDVVKDWVKEHKEKKAAHNARSLWSLLFG